MKTVQIRDALHKEMQRIIKKYPFLYGDPNEFVNAAVIREIEKVYTMEPQWGKKKAK